MHDIHVQLPPTEAPLDEQAQAHAAWLEVEAQARKEQQFFEARELDLCAACEI